MCVKTSTMVYTPPPSASHVLTIEIQHSLQTLETRKLSMSTVYTVQCFIMLNRLYCQTFLTHDSQCFPDNGIVSVL